MLINTALKEWSVAVDAITQGSQVILLRKGGIKEDQGHFRTQSDQVVLFPTFEHQKPEMLKSDYKGSNYQSSVVPVASGWHPEKITLKVWAQITHIFLTTAADQVSALNDFHIWQPRLATERLRWKPKQPLYVLALRAYQLSAPVEIVWDSELYGGCRSWVPLSQPIEASTDHPAIDSDTYDIQIKKIKEIISARS